MEKLTPHICQSPEWGEFKTKMGTPAFRPGNVQFTLHPIPKTPFFVGYAPKIDPEKIDYQKLYEAGKKYKCIFIKTEPNALLGHYQLPTTNYQLISSRPIFARQTILLDLTQTEGQILAAMHPKTRYNIFLAQRRGVTVQTTGIGSDLNSFLQLQKDTARRQGFYLHPDNYYRTCFEMLNPKGMAYLLLATLPQDHTTTKPQVLAAWMLFRYGQTLYYPYGGSDYQYRNLMASNLLMWEAIRLGKSLGCTVFDLWGACDNPQDPWYGFTKFKLGFGGKIITFAPAADLVVNPLLYPLVVTADKLRWGILKTVRRITQ